MVCDLGDGCTAEWFRTKPNSLYECLVISNAAKRERIVLYDGSIAQLRAMFARQDGKNDHDATY